MGGIERERHELVVEAVPRAPDESDSIPQAASPDDASPSVSAAPVEQYDLRPPSSERVADPADTPAADADLQILPPTAARVEGIEAQPAATRKTIPSPHLAERPNLKKEAPAEELDGATPVSPSPAALEGVKPADEQPSVADEEDDIAVAKEGAPQPAPQQEHALGTVALATEVPSQPMPPDQTIQAPEAKGGDDSEEDSDAGEDADTTERSTVDHPFDQIPEPPDSAGGRGDSGGDEGPPEGGDQSPEESEPDPEQQKVEHLKTLSVLFSARETDFRSCTVQYGPDDPITLQARQARDRAKDHYDVARAVAFRKDDYPEEMRDMFDAERKFVEVADEFGPDSSQARIAHVILRDARRNFRMTAMYDIQDLPAEQRFNEQRRRETRLLSYIPEGVTMEEHTAAVADKLATPYEGMRELQGIVRSAVRRAYLGTDEAFPAGAENKFRSGASLPPSMETIKKQCRILLNGAEMNESVKEVMGMFIDGLGENLLG